MAEWSCRGAAFVCQTRRKDWAAAVIEHTHTHTHTVTARERARERDIHNVTLVHHCFVWFATIVAAW